jgi:hypothetical protein
MITPEGRVKKQIRDWLREKGAYFFSPVQQGYGASTLDILVCWKGEFVAIEVKAENKNLTGRQEAIAKQIESSHGRVIVAYSLQDVINGISS